MGLGHGQPMRLWREQTDRVMRALGGGAAVQGPAMASLLAHLTLSQAWATSLKHQSDGRPTRSGKATPHLRSNAGARRHSSRTPPPAQPQPSKAASAPSPLQPLPC